MYLNIVLVKMFNITNLLPKYHENSPARTYAMLELDILIFTVIMVSAIYNTITQTMDYEDKWLEN